MTLNIPCRSNPMPYYVGAIDYSSLPMTFECVSGSINLSLPLYRQRVKQSASLWNGSNSKLNSMYYKKTGESTWTDWKALNYVAVPLSAGEKIEISGQNYGNMCSYWGDYVNRFELNGTGEAILYGNISSLFRTDVETVRIMNIMLAGPGDYTYDNILTDASKFIIPYKTNSTEGLNVFCRYSLLRGGPLFTNTNYYSGMFSHQFEKCYALSSVEASFIRTSSWSENAFFDGIANTSPSGIFILPQSTYKPSKGTGTCPVNWIYLNRMSDGSLQFAQNATWKGESHVSGDVFPTEDDPYAWYYAFHKPNR